MSGGGNRLAVLAADIRAAHQDSVNAAMTLAERALAAGAALMEAKRLVAHGEWQTWLRENCGLSARSARRYMSLAASGMKTATVAVLGVRGASEALTRRRAASIENAEFKDDREVPAEPKESHTGHPMGSQAGVTVSANLDSGGGDSVTVVREDPSSADPTRSGTMAVGQEGLATDIDIRPEKCRNADHLKHPAQCDLFEDLRPAGEDARHRKRVDQQLTCGSLSVQPLPPDQLIAVTVEDVLAGILEEQIDPRRRTEVIALLGSCSRRRLVEAVRRGPLLRSAND